MPKAIGRAAQRVITSSLMRAKPKWTVVVPSQPHRSYADMVVKTKKHHVLIKVKTTRKDYFKLSMFGVGQLNELNKFHMRGSNHLSLAFFYFAEAKKLVSVDIHTLLTVKSNKFSIEDLQSMGYTIENWQQFGRYFTVMLGFKQKLVYKKGRCYHEWLVESCEEAFQRASSKQYSMGYCRKCGIVRNDFENFLTPNPTFSPIDS